MKTIRARMLSILIPIVVISLLASSGILYNLAKDKISSHIIQQNQSDAQLISNETGVWLGRFFTLIDMSAKTDGHLKLDNAARIKYMGEMMKIDPSVSDIYLGTAEGAMLDGSGWVPPADYDPRIRPWYGSAIDAGGTAYSDPYLDLVTGKVVTSVSSPVKKADGSILGVLAADIQLIDVTENINAVKVGETGYAIIMTNGGTIVAHPNTEMIGKSGLTELGDDIKNLTEAVTKSDLGTYYYSYEGVKKIATFSKIPNTSWKIVLTMPMKEITQEIDALFIIVLITSTIFIFITIAAVWIITGKITKPIAQLNNITYKFAEGDFTNRTDVKSNTEVGHLADSFNSMADNIGSLVGGITHLTNDVHSVANELNDASVKTEHITRQVSQAINDLAKGAELQASSVNESVHKVNSMVTSIEDVNKGITLVYDLTEAIEKLVHQGEKAIELQNVNMIENTTATNNVNDAIHLLEERTKEISQIVTVIDGIAAQTNLLALNASIEAARAGEQGRGFSVVADEIRKLAEQSSQSTSQISDSIKDIINRTQSAVAQAEIAENAVKEQSSSVDQVVDIFKNVTHSIEDIKQKFNSSRESMSNIRTEAQGIKNAITDISDVIELNAAGSEEVAAATEQQVNTLAEVSRLAGELEMLAGDLQHAVEKFKV